MAGNSRDRAVGIIIFTEELRKYTNFQLFKRKFLIHLYIYCKSADRNINELEVSEKISMTFSVFNGDIAVTSCC